MIFNVLIHCLLFQAILCQEALNTTTETIDANQTVTELPPNTTIATTTTTQKPVVNNYQYIVRLEYTFREEKIPEFFSGVIAGGIEDTAITIADLIELFNLKDFSLNDTEAYLDMIGVPYGAVFNVNMLEMILNNLQLPFTNFYVALNESLSLSPAKLSQIIKDFKLDAGKFTSAIVLGEYDIYEVLRAGTFTKETIEQASKTAEIPIPVIFDAAKNIILDNLKRLDRREFDYMLKQNKIDQRMILLLWSALSVTIEDVYKVENLRNFLGEIVFNLNVKTSMGVITKQNTLLLHTADFDMCQNNRYTIRTSVRSILNSSITLELKNLKQKVTPNVVEVTLKGQSSASIEIGRKFSSPVIENCTYVTFVNNMLVFQDVYEVMNNEYELAFGRSNQTFFLPGSPIICHDKLYGLATDANETTIKFDSLYEYDSATRTTLWPDEGGQKIPNGATSNLHGVAAMFLLSIISLMYIFCS